MINQQTIYEMKTQKEIAECYQPLFSYLSKQHGLTLLKSEMDEIRSLVDEVNENLYEALRDVCDAEGCNEDVSNGGVCWQETGYWSLCSKHFQMHRDGNPQPAMKQIAIDKEKSRLPNGYLPINSDQ